MYYVYRRDSDGFIGVVNTSEKLGAGEKPERLRGRDETAGRPMYMVLLATPDWTEASELIEAKRRLAPACPFNTLPPQLTPPNDPAEMRRRTIDEIATRLASIERELHRLDAEISECHGYASPAQLMVEMAGDCVKKAMRANGKAKS